MVDGFREVPRELAGFPYDGKDFATLIVKGGELSGVNAVKGRGLVRRVGRPRLADLIGGEAGEGRSLLDGEVPTNGAGFRAAPEFVALGSNFVKVRLGVNSSPRCC